MAGGFEPYHVPQQSRRDKLRVAAELHGLMTSQPPYDHRSLIEVSGSSDLLTCNIPREDNLMAMAGLGSSSSGLRNPYGSFDPGLLYGAATQMTHSGAAAAFKPEPLSLSLSSAYDDDNGMGVNDGVSRGSVPLGPFTGYASALKGSRFLVPAQQLLVELCCDVVGVAVSAEKIAPDSSLMAIVDHDGDDDGDHGNNDDIGDNNNNNNNNGGGDDENFKKKSRLISMLDEVYRRYKQYYQQMQAVVTSFEYVAGLGNAAPYASLAVKAMTRHFRCLKNAIMDQLRFANKAYPGGHRKDETAPTFRSSTSNTRGAVYGQMIGPARHHHGSGLLDHQPVWRPQRGLPERAVTVLRAWLFEHFLHPYPTDTDKMMLAKQTGLSRSQVSNWFINARVRLWKPMVEEIHMLETRQAHNNKSSVAVSAAATTTTTRPNNDTSAAANHPKRSRNNNNNELQVYSLPEDVMGSSYGDGPPGHPQLQAAGPAGPNGSGVSLTLGLHQDGGGAGMCLAQRFGIGEGYVVAGGAFEAAHHHHHHQSRHFGGQLLRDFVG